MIDSSAIHCPFCGCEEILVEFKKSGDHSGYQAHCCNCKVGQAAVWYATEKAAILAWNHRVPAKPKNPDDLLAEKIRARIPVAHLDAAYYIDRQLKSGVAKGVIAKNLKRSASFVTQHLKLLDLPKPIEEALSFGTINDLTVMSELVIIYNHSPDLVTKWLSEPSLLVTRATVKEIRAISGYDVAA